MHAYAGVLNIIPCRVSEGFASLGLVGALVAPVLELRRIFPERGESRLRSRPRLGGSSLILCHSDAYQLLEKPVLLASIQVWKDSSH